jgi:RHS repeat-associated protein
MLAIQESSQVKWVHQDPVTKSQRLTNSSGTVVSVVDLDPWGAETSRSSQEQLQPHRYTSYERDANEGDEAQQRRYQAWWTRFSQPDPFDGSYDLTDPQSFNRYSYVSNDPVNMVDPSGLDEVVRVYSWARAPRWGPFDASMGGFSGIMRHYTENEPFFIAPLWLNRDRESSAEPQQPASNNEGQPLSDCVKNLLAKYFDRNLLDAIRIHNNSRVPPKMGGYTYKDNVYFKGQNNQHSRVEIAELGHEIEHAQQYRTHTFFLAQYFLDVLGMHSHPILGPIVEGDMIFGSGSIGHDMNRFEKPAMKRERQINTDLANKDTPCP